MAEFQLDIKDIENQDAALNISELFLDTAIDEKGLRKEFVTTFFSNALNNLENQSASPNTKFYTLFILKQLSTKDKVTLKIFGTFSQHPLYGYLQELALTIDPKKPMSEKGKSLFATDKNMGNNFMRLLLESLVSWGTRFPTNAKKEPTRFKKTLTKLQDEKVVLPKQLTFYQSQKKSERVETPQGPKESSKPDLPTNKGLSNDVISNNASANNVPKAKDSKQKQFAQVKFMYNKIDALLGILQDSQSVEQLQRQIQSYHLKFQKDMQKLSEIENEIIESNDVELMHLYFKVVEFFNEERMLFKENVSKNQYDVYITGYGIAYQRIFQDKKQSKPNSKLEPSIDKKIGQNKTDSKIKSGLPPPKPTLQKIKSEKSDINQDSRLAQRQKENLKKKASQKEGPAKDSRGGERENRLKDNKNIIQTCFSKLQAYSKSPHQGFGSIAKSLERQKKPTVVSRVKASNVVTTLNKSKFTGGSTFSKSAVKLKGIFLAPPNPNIRAKSYEGELVTQNLDLQRQFETMRKEQGMRRLKSALFKNKYVLYEDDCLQVGFKSTFIHQQVDKFVCMIDFELFFGNKTSKTINNFEVSFRGDKQSLIYTNPQVVDSTIFPQSQVKLQLLNIPKSYSFGLVTINASYEYAEQTRTFSALLPNSVLQMTSYFHLATDKLPSVWGQCPRVLKTDLFKLSHYFPPDQLTHLLPMLKERVPYSKFAEEGSIVDYQLFAEIFIRESYEGLLKIIIRPDLSVVLQAGLYTGDDQSVQNFRFYLQSLQVALREIEA